MNNDHLRHAREDRGWTQQQLADELGVGIITVRSWEKDKRSPGTNMQQRLCQIFSKTSEQLGLRHDEK